MPNSCLGKWSVGLIFIFFLSFVTLRLLVSYGQRGGEAFFSNPLFAVSGILAAVAGILAFFTGIAGILKFKERSVLVFLATAIGFLIFFFCLGEILSPH